MTRAQLWRTFKIAACLIWSWAIYMVLGHLIIRVNPDYWWLVIPGAVGIGGAYVFIMPTLNQTKREEMFLALLITALVIAAAGRVL